MCVSKEWDIEGPPQFKNQPAKNISILNRRVAEKLSTRLMDIDTDTACFLKQREECNIQLRSDPHNPARHLLRGQVHAKLGFPDLAAADAYHALTLFEAVIDPDISEYDARKRVGSVGGGSIGDNSPGSDASVSERLSHSDIGSGSEEEDDEGAFEPVSLEEYETNIGEVYTLLVQSLADCGCMRDAYEFCVQAMNLPGKGKIAHSKDLKKLLCKIKSSVVDNQSDAAGDDKKEFDPAHLDAQGLARRVVYPWNTHEPDRNSPDVVEFLNHRLREVAPKCEVRAVALPLLHDSKDGADGNEDISIQLGLFAKENISAGETILHESSMLTATNRLHDDICDACNSRLPELSAPEPPVACEDCADTIFCSEKCHDMAQEVYHSAVCGQEGLETIGKDIQDPKDKADYLYLLLLGRAIAMAATQDVHPLDLPEVKYIWGDFHELDDDSVQSAVLPFSFQLNVLQPMRILEEMGLDPFISLPHYDTWVFNTLYAKFRGTASGRLSTWDGGPEVCAVHPLWCLANHSCDPNVRWEWGGEITFTARAKDEKVNWGPEEDQKRRENAGPGIEKDTEILNHYCDLGLVVQERRDWAMGALGGACRCERCEWEAAQ